MKEAGQGKSDDAEVAWVEREAEVASVKAMIAEVTREIEDSQRDIFDPRQEITPGEAPC